MLESGDDFVLARQVTSTVTSNLKDVLGLASVLAAQQGDVLLGDRQAAWQLQRVS